jgi:hypothetical protein
MGRLQKHLDMGEPVTINGEQFIIRGLGTESLPVFFRAMKAFSGAKTGGSVEDMLRNMTDDGSKAISELIDRTLEKSMPDEPIEDRKEFGMKYMSILLNKIFELNSAMITDNKDKAKELVSKFGKPNT